MRREFFVHLAFLLSFYILISIFRGWLSFSYWPFWLGGVVSAFLPDVDHLIYIYFLRPQELNSQRAAHLLGQKDVVGAVSLLSDTRGDREKLVFHTAIFQIVFLVLTFFVVTSSGSLFGYGIVLSFCLHFVVDQAFDIKDGTWGRWFTNLPFVVGRENFKKYWIVMIAVIFVFGFIL